MKKKIIEAILLVAPFLLSIIGYLIFTNPLIVIAGIGLSSLMGLIILSMLSLKETKEENENKKDI